MHQFLKFIFGIKLYMFRTFPLSIIRSFSLYTQQWYMSYRFCWQLASRIRMEPRTELVPSCSCPQAVTVTCMTYTVAVCTVKNSWWWTEKLSETCRVSLFQKQIWEISVSSWFYYKNSPQSVCATECMKPCVFTLPKACCALLLNLKLTACTNPGCCCSHISHLSVYSRTLPLWDAKGVHWMGNIPICPLIFKCGENCTLHQPPKSQGLKNLVNWWHRKG